jgi:uncharacterized protein YcfL
MKTLFTLLLSSFLFIACSEEKKDKPVATTTDMVVSMDMGSSDMEVTQSDMVASDVSVSDMEVVSSDMEISIVDMSSDMATVSTDMSVDMVVEGDMSVVSDMASSK